MKKTTKTKLLAIVVLLTCFAGTSFAQATATATATATIVTPISISKTADMSFGNIAVSASTGGTVVLAPAGTRTSTSGVTLPATAGTVTAAAFTVNGTGSYTYAITLPSTTTLTRVSGTETMTANAFTSNPSGTGALTGGTQALAVGATLTVAAAQVAGTYNSTAFNVTVNYN
ncbi:MAG: DUF4402 domain-containing protein [Bacteroidota bacterium]|nr:DUF4402 domain-containing protein [Bacteroidota bacterium]